MSIKNAIFSSKIQTIIPFLTRKTLPKTEDRNLVFDYSSGGGVPQSLVPGPFPASGPMSFPGVPLVLLLVMSKVLFQSWPGGTQHTPVLARGYPRWGSPKPGLGYSLQLGLQYPPGPGLGYPQTGYGMGGMPLAFSCRKDQMEFCFTKFFCR